MANRITTLFDFSDNGGIKKIQRDIAATEGTLNKVKVAAKGAFDSFRQSNLQQAAAIAGIGYATKQAIDAASDLNESTNAIMVTFGESADAVLAIGENSAKSLGLSKNEFNQLAVQASSFVKTIAEGQGRTVPDVLADYTQRIADFASVMNIDVPEAARVFQSALAGETEPIRKYGKDLSAANVEQFALKNGLIETKSELTETLKQQARYGLVMQLTSDTQGDFANTSDGLANSQRTLGAEWENLQAAIGEDLAPALANLILAMQSLVEVSDTLHLDDIFKIPSGAEKLGTLIGQVLSPWNTGARQKNKEIVDAYNDSVEAAEAFNRAQLDGLTTFAQVHAKVLENTGDLTAANMVAVEWTRTMELAAGQTLDQKEALEQQAESMQASQRQGESYVDFLTGRYRRAQDEIAAATDRARRANQLHADAVNAERDAILGSLSSMFDYEKSQRSTADAVAALAVAIDSDLRPAQIAVAEAALAQSEAFAAQTGAVDGSTASTKLQIEELQRLQQQTPQVADEIQRYIDKLNEIPAVRETQLVLTPSGGVTTKQTTNQFGRLVAGAEGAIVNRPTLALIGEAGPEAVIPLGQSPGNSPLPAATSTQSRSGPVRVDIDGKTLFRIMWDETERQSRSGWRPGPGVRRVMAG